MAADPINIAPELDGLYGKHGPFYADRTLINGGDDDLSDLLTTNKSNLVAAINEVKNLIGTGGASGDTALRNLVNGGKSDLSDLTTSDKSTVLAAINELAARPVGGAGNGFYVKTIADVVNTDIPAPTITFVVGGYAAEGDVLPCRYRRAVASEYALPSVLTSKDGSKWIIGESTVIPEWFGAKGDANGFSASNPDPVKAAGAGNDDAPALRDMLKFMSALSVAGTTLPGRKYRIGSHSAHPGGQKAALVPTSNTHFTVRSDIIHDSYDPVSGSVSFWFTGGTSANRVKNIRLKFDGGAFVHPADAVKPRPEAKKGSITFYYCDEFELVRVKKTGPSPTNFQVSIFYSTNGLIDGGFVGYPSGPVDVGDDGFHIIGECNNIICSGLIINSGDDPISITHENNMIGKTIERILISDIICTTPIANIIKFHIINDEAGGGSDKTSNCIIQDVSIRNVYGRLLGDLQGAAITIQNDDPTKGNIIRRIDIDRPIIDIGKLPKTNTFVSLQGQAIRIYKSDDVNITNARITGQHNSQLMFYGCNGGSFQGTLINSSTNNSSVNLLSGVGVTSAAVGGVSRRITFAGQPNLTAVKAQLDAANNWFQVNDLKYPILTLSGMTVAGHNGRFVIRAVDVANYTVDVENFRGNVADDTSGTGTASIDTGTMPSIMLLDSNDIRVRATVENAQSYTAAYIGARNIVSSARNELDLVLKNQTVGAGITTGKASQSRIAAVARNCKSGSYMIRINQAAAVSDPYNHVLNSDDFGSLADPLQGFGRTVLTDYANDRFDTVRGRVPTRLVGTVNQANAATTFEITGINVNAYGGHLSTNVTPAHLLKLTPRSNGSTILGVAWDSGAAKFTITTTAAPGACTWDYVITPPN